MRFAGFFYVLVGSARAVWTYHSLPRWVPDATGTHGIRPYLTSKGALPLKRITASSEDREDMFGD